MHAEHSLTRVSHALNFHDTHDDTPPIIVDGPAWDRTGLSRTYLCHSWKNQLIRVQLLSPEATFPGRAVQPTSMVGMIDRPAVFFFGGGLPINVIVTAHLVKITWELEEEGLLQRHSRD